MSSKVSEMKDPKKRIHPTNIPKMDSDDSWTMQVECGKRENKGILGIWLKIEYT